MKYITLSIFISISILSTGCLFLSNDALEKKELSKEDAKKRADKGDEKDYCEIFDWYGDGTCDEFCVDPDMDCFTCDAQPQCEQGFEVVDACNGEEIAGYVCKESSFCGQTIYCEKTEACLFDAIALECPEGYYPAEACDENSNCIQMDEPCGGTTFCVEDIPTCSALPTCREDQFEVEKCRLGDDLCEDLVLCGSTISCSDNLDCDAFPVCEKDETAHPSREVCEQNNTTCRQNYVCSSIIYCSGTVNCRPPVCDVNDIEIMNCEDGQPCYEKFGCGQSILCLSR